MTDQDFLKNTPILKMNKLKHNPNINIDLLTDYLTGVFSRYAWDKLITLEHQRCKNYGHITIKIIIYIDDLDFQKNYTQSLINHKIHKVAQILKKSVQSTTQIVARLDENTFGILNIETNLKDTQKLADKIFKHLQKIGIPISIKIIGLGFSQESNLLL